MRRLLELLSEANHIEYRDGKPVLLIDYRKRRLYRVKYNDKGDPVEIIEEEI
jgi:hypothetical protein